MDCGEFILLCKIFRGTRRRFLFCCAKFWGNADWAEGRGGVIYVGLDFTAQNVGDTDWTDVD